MKSYQHIQTWSKVLATAFSALLCTTGNSADRNAVPSLADFQAFGERAVKIIASADQAAIKRCVKDFKLPDSTDWFKQVFGAEVGARLNREYSDTLKDFDTDVKKFLQECIAEGKVEVKVEMYERAIDMRANGLQNYALQMMLKPVPLCALRLVKPGHELGSSLWSFAYVDGKFRLLGKMKALRLTQTRGDLVSDLLDNMPLGLMEETLKKKGMLTEGAVTYLQSRGRLLKQSKSRRNQ